MLTILDNTFICIKVYKFDLSPIGEITMKFQVQLEVEQGGGFPREFLLLGLIEAESTEDAANKLGLPESRSTFGDRHYWTARCFPPPLLQTLNYREEDWEEGLSLTIEPYAPPIALHSSEDLLRELARHRRGDD